MSAPLHKCHWPDCKRDVPSRMWGCRAHWNMLPVKLKQRIEFHYRAGQEVDKNPSQQYMKAAHDVQEWIKAWKQANS